MRPCSSTCEARSRTPGLQPGVGDLAEAERARCRSAPPARRCPPRARRGRCRAAAWILGSAWRRGRGRSRLRDVAMTQLPLPSPQGRSNPSVVGCEKLDTLLGMPIGIGSTTSTGRSLRCCARTPGARSRTSARTSRCRRRRSSGASTGSRPHGVIRGYTRGRRSRRAGLGRRTPFVALYCEGASPPREIRDGRRASPRGRPAAYTVAGEASAILHVRARDTEHLEETLERLRDQPGGAAHPHLGRALDAAGPPVHAVTPAAASVASTRSSSQPSHQPPTTSSTSSNPSAQNSTGW